MAADSNSRNLAVFASFSVGKFGWPLRRSCRSGRRVSDIRFLDCYGDAGGPGVDAPEVKLWASVVLDVNLAAYGLLDVKAVQLIWLPSIEAGYELFCESLNFT